MKKTVTSSIGRIAFTLEEDAYQKLSEYLNDISHSLSNSEGHDEIMADIEARIAELIQQRIKGSQQVVTLAEVNEVIEIMGSPDTFATTEEKTQKQEAYAHANESDRAYYSYRRVFRDTDDKVLCGVCSGVAHHFGINPLWLRLAFGLSIFMGGFGIILYILLWIIIPKARTSSEKLEMHGEPADINHIKHTVEEELADLKRKVNDVKTNFRSGRYRNTGKNFGRNVGDFFNSAGHGLGNAVGSIVRAVVAVVMFIFAFVFSILLIALLISLFSGVNVVQIHGSTTHIAHYSVHKLFTLLALTGAAKVFIILGIGLFVGIPLLACIIRIWRHSMKLTGRITGVKITLLIAWMLGLMFLLIASIQTFGRFSVTGTATDNIAFNVPGKTLYVKMTEETYGNISIKTDSLNFYIDTNGIFSGNPSLCLEQSPDSNFHLQLNKMARGISRTEASASATDIVYGFSQHDSVLSLNPYFQIENGTGWRKQKLDVVLLIPVGKTFTMPQGIDHIMCSAVHSKYPHIGGHRWLMNTSGIMAADSLPAKQ